mmetsp:Transcript_10508/g.44711  ORF Transcript_10508/g.44711 Transcript_10508/m.44711 type:complete len:269 (+) Transcript_10508:412-1218(+)
MRTPLSSAHRTSASARSKWPSCTAASTGARSRRSRALTSAPNRNKHRADGQSPRTHASVNSVNPSKVSSSSSSPSFGADERVKCASMISFSGVPRWLDDSKKSRKPSASPRLVKRAAATNAAPTFCFTSPPSSVASRPASIRPSGAAAAAAASSANRRSRRCFHFGTIYSASTAAAARAARAMADAEAETSSEASFRSGWHSPSSAAMRASILALLCLSASSAAASANAVERASSTSICPCDLPMRRVSATEPRAASAASKRSRRARN